MMGYLFQDIGQLAGFFAKQAGDSTLEKADKQTSEISFESIFDSLAGNMKNELNQVPENDQVIDNVEYSEKAIINEEFLRALIEKQGSRITLDLSSNKISHYLDVLSMPAFNKKYGNELLLAENPEQSGKFGLPDQTGSTYHLSFNVADLIGKENLPVEIIDTGGEKNTRVVDVSRLARLLLEYPEPVQAEVEIIPEQEKHGDMDQLKSSFRFDLRNLLSPDASKSNGRIEGVISFTNGRSTENPNASSGHMNFKYDINENHLKPSPAGSHNNQIANSHFKGDGLNGLIPTNLKLSLPQLGINYKNLYVINNSNVNRSNIASEPFNEIESAGADTESVDKDNPSVFSKKPVGSDGASDKIPHESYKGALDKIVDQYGLSKGLMVKESLGNIEELHAKYLETLQNIKANIFNAIEHGHSVVRMRLYPPELGALHIKLQWRAGLLSAEFRVENSKAGEIVHSILPELKESLEEANLRLNNINVLVEGRGRGFSASHNPHDQSGFAGNGPRGDSQSTFKGYDQSESETFDENAKKTDNQESRSSHKGWIDLKA